MANTYTQIYIQVVFAVSGRANLLLPEHKEEINRYISIAEHAIKPNGYLIISTFSEQGPKKCSGLDITQYSESSLANKLAHGFEELDCIIEDHFTPAGIAQNFLSCCFKKN